MEARHLPLPLRFIRAVMLPLMARSPRLAAIVVWWAGRRTGRYHPLLLERLLALRAMWQKPNKAP